jgi:hypothetical protein
MRRILARDLGICRRDRRACNNPLRALSQHCTFRQNLRFGVHLASNGLTWFRSRQRTLTQGVLALFCLVWLQVALLPCAMATVPDGMSGAPEEHCPYCPPAPGADVPGDEAPGTCSYPDGPQVDTRGTLATAAAPTVAPLPVLLAPWPALVAAPLPDDPDASLPRTSLAVSYCRFLE